MALAMRSNFFRGVASVKDWRLFNVVGKGAGWCVLCGMSPDLGFRIEAIGRLVSLTARIIRSLRDTDITVPISTSASLKLNGILFRGMSLPSVRHKKDSALQSERDRQKVFCEFIPTAIALFVG